MKSTIGLFLLFAAMALTCSCGRGVRQGVDITVTQLANQQKWYGCSLDLWRSYNVETHIYDDGVTHFVDDKGISHDFPTQGFVSITARRRAGDIRARPEMPIRIQIVTEKWNPISAAIRFSTRSWASHAEFVDTAAGITLGARSIGGVKYRLCEKDHYSRIEQFVVDKAADMVAAWTWAATQVGKPYDFSAVSGIAFDRDWHDESKWFCSELVIAAFEAAGLPLLSTRPSAAVYRYTPRDLLLSRNIIYVGNGGC